MSLKNLRVPIRWTDQHSIKYSLLLALAGYAGTIVLQIIYPNNAQVGLPDFWRAYSLIAAALGFLIPQILLLGKRILFLFLPRPGALTFDELTIRKLSESFEFDRTRLAAAMVPDHIATATPAQNARQINLADAALILDEQQEWTIQQFIGHPKKFAPISKRCQSGAKCFDGDRRTRSRQICAGSRDSRNALDRGGKRISLVRTAAAVCA